MTSFSLDSLKAIELADKPVLEPLLLALEPHSCEMNFLNLYAWGFANCTKFTIFAGLPWVWYPPEQAALLPRAYTQTALSKPRPGDRGEDILLFPGGLNPERWPSPQLLQAVTAVFQQHGYAGIIRNVPAEYVQAYPEIRSLYMVEKASRDVGEYLYSVASLVSLRGRRLGKKKNLIAQFLQSYPDHAVLPFTADCISACQQLAESWYASRETSNYSRMEAAALQQTFAAVDELAVEGFCLYVNKKLIAFSIFTRLNSNTCDEHFEKVDINYKGGAQFLNQQMMKSLLGKYEFVNREQDLGIPGLRQAKKSYEPVQWRRNFQFTPRTLEQ